MKFIAVLALILVPLVCLAQGEKPPEVKPPEVKVNPLKTDTSLAKNIFDAKVKKDTELLFIKEAALVTLEDREFIDKDGKMYTQKVAKDDVGITIHNHFLPDGTAITTMQVAKQRFIGKSIFDEYGNATFKVETVE